MTTTGYDPSAPAVNPGFLKPVRHAPPTPDPAVLASEPRGSAYLLYLRSYLLLRLLIGALGVALPVVLVVGDPVLLGGKWLPYGSLSAYYFSGMRDAFVGVLFVIGFFLFTYKVFERNLDNTLSSVAGLAAVVVAFFPTGRPSDAPSPSTPLQEAWGESLVRMLHFGGAAVFIVSLGFISYYFGVREGDRPQLPGRRSPQFWRRFHMSSAAAIAAAVLYIVVAKVGELVGLFAEDWVLIEYSLLIGEIIAVFAFGVSWLAKGLELPLHLGLRPVPAPPDVPPPAAAAGPPGQAAADR